MSDAKCPLDRFYVYWCDGALGIHIDGGPGLWNGARLRPVEVVRADIADASRAEVQRLRDALEWYSTHGSCIIGDAGARATAALASEPAAAGPSDAVRVLADLVGALPKCAYCSSNPPAPATKFSGMGADFCDEHGGHYPMHDYAGPLRAAQALLAGGATTGEGKR